MSVYKIMFNAYVFQQDYFVFLSIHKFLTLIKNLLIN